MAEGNSSAPTAAVPVNPFAWCPATAGGARMSLDLLELKRLRITAETAAWLKAESMSTGRSQQEIAREELDRIAREKIHAALVPAEGPSGDSGGRRR